jgi:hypothetical protein
MLSFSWVFFISSTLIL